MRKLSGYQSPQPEPYSFYLLTHMHASKFCSFRATRAAFYMYMYKYKYTNTKMYTHSLYHPCPLD
jgi:hypothetical protein